MTLDTFRFLSESILRFKVYLRVAESVEEEDGERECEVEREDHGVERDVGLVDGVQTEEPGSDVGRDREEQTLLVGAGTI